MADATHDFGDEGFHEIHLSGKQLVFLFMATTVVAVVIFLLGVQVGRGAPALRAEDTSADSLETAAAAAAPAEAQPLAEAPPVVAEPPAPPAEGDEFTYKRRLEGEAAPADRLEPAPEPAPPAAARPAPERPAAAQRAAAQSPPSQPIAGTAQPGTWVLQVHALRDAKVASSIVQRLSKKGYPAYLVASGGPAGIYRVFVGKYKDREDAQRVADRLKREEQFAPWITR